MDPAPLLSLSLTRLATLDLAAASGIQRRADRLYVVADDELALGVYDLHGASLGRISLLPGDLPDGHAERKAKKPDFEALLTLPDRSLLALGSGSTPHRRRAVRIDFSASEASPRVQVHACDALYLALERELPELNLEGAVVFRERLLLCSRGNSARRDDALIELDLDRVTSALAADRAPGAEVVRDVRRIAALPSFDGAPLSLTDLSVLSDRLLFTAAAEASPNTYDDGITTGSVIGEITADDETIVFGYVRACKLEGICPAGQSALYAVADADDRSSGAPLFRVELDRRVA